jgi:hypothetical protein
VDGAHTVSAEPPEQGASAPGGGQPAAGPDRIERLERENAALRRANAKLMRERIGSSNTAAAGRLAARPRHGAAQGGLAASVRAPLARLRLALRRLLLRVLR